MGTWYGLVYRNTSLHPSLLFLLTNPNLFLKISSNDIDGSCFSCMDSPKPFMWIWLVVCHGDFFFLVKIEFKITPEGRAQIKDLLYSM